jgi:hypothetical protein
MLTTAVAARARAGFWSVLEWNHCGKRIVTGCLVKAAGDMKADILEFWQGYLAGLQPSHFDRQPKPDSVFSFGNSSEIADQLAILVRHGVKTATCSALSSYRAYRVKNILPRVPQSLHPGSLSDFGVSFAMEQ